MITLERLIEKTSLSDDAFICDIDDFNSVLKELIDYGFKIECCDVDVLMEEPFIVEFDEGSVAIEQYREGYKFFHAVDTLHVDKSIEKKFYEDVRRNHTLRFELDWEDDDYCDCSTCDDIDCPENPRYECTSTCIRCDNCGTCYEAKLPSKEDEEERAAYYVDGKKVTFEEFDEARKKIEAHATEIKNDIKDLRKNVFKGLLGM